MGILNDLLTRVEGVNDALQTGELVRWVLVPREEDILELQREQLFQGLASDGQDIRPYYSEDLKPEGYFHSKESAKRYSVWKEGIQTPFSAKRNPDAPNLYINGRFHSELCVRFGADALAVEGGTGYASALVAKYGLGTFGLTGQNWWRIFAERGAFEELMTEIKARIYGK